MLLARPPSPKAAPVLSSWGGVARLHPHQESEALGESPWHRRRGRAPPTSLPSCGTRGPCRAEPSRAERRGAGRRLPSAAGWAGVGWGPAAGPAGGREFVSVSAAAGQWRSLAEPLARSLARSHRWGGGGLGRFHPPAGPGAERRGAERSGAERGEARLASAARCACVCVREGSRPPPGRRRPASPGSNRLRGLVPEGDPRPRPRPLPLPPPALADVLFLSHSEISNKEKNFFQTTIQLSPNSNLEVST